MDGSCLLAFVDCKASPIHMTWERHGCGAVPLGAICLVPLSPTQLQVERLQRSPMAMGKLKPREGQQWATVTQHLEVSRAENVGLFPPAQGSSTSWSSPHWPKPLPFYESSIRLKNKNITKQSFENYGIFGKLTLQDPHTVTSTTHYHEHINRGFTKTSGYPCKVEPLCSILSTSPATTGFTSCARDSQSLDLDSKIQHMTLDYILYCRGGNAVENMIGQLAKLESEQ